MNHQNSQNPGAGKSSLFGIEENVSAAAVGAVTLAASFVPYASYFAWVIPLAAAAAERKSGFARLCDAQTFLCAAVTCICSLITLLITPYAESAMNAAAGNSLMAFGVVGVLMSLLRVAGMVLVILTAYNAFKGRVFDIPGVTVSLKKAIKYSK